MAFLLRAGVGGAPQSWPGGGGGGPWGVSLLHPTEPLGGPLHSAGRDAANGVRRPLCGCLPPPPQSGRVAAPGPAGSTTHPESFLCPPLGTPSLSARKVLLRPCHHHPPPPGDMCTKLPVTSSFHGPPRGQRLAWTALPRAGNTQTACRGPAWHTSQGSPTPPRNRADSRDPLVGWPGRVRAWGGRGGGEPQSQHTLSLELTGDVTSHQADR